MRCAVAERNWSWNDWYKMRSKSRRSRFMQVILKFFVISTWSSFHAKVSLSFAKKLTNTNKLSTYFFIKYMCTLPLLYRNHLREHLSRVICRLKLETIDILTCDDLETIVTREGKKRPPRGYSTPENEYYKALYQVPTFLLSKFVLICKVNDLSRVHFFPLLLHYSMCYLLFLS